MTTDPETTLEEILLDGGLSARQVSELTPLLDEWAEAEAMTRAAEAIRHMLCRLDGTAAAIALRRVCLGEDSLSIREQARAIGVSHQSILKAEKLARRKLGLPPATRVET